MRERRIRRPQRGCKETFVIGEQVLLQDPVLKKWSISAEITNVRLAPDNQILSYELRTENERLTTRHRANIKKLHKNNSDNNNVPVVEADNTDIPRNDEPEYCMDQGWQITGKAFQHSGITGC